MRTLGHGVNDTHDITAAREVVDVASSVKARALTEPEIVELTSDAKRR